MPDIRPDVEELYMALLEDLGWTDTILPEDMDPDDPDDLPIIIIQRDGGGGISADGLNDIAHLFVSVIGKDREHARDILQECTRRILNDGDQYNLGDWHIERALEMTGDAPVGDYNPYRTIRDAMFTIRVSLRFD